MSGTTIVAVATATAPDRPAGATAGGATEDVGFVAALVAALAGSEEPTPTSASEVAAPTGAAPAEAHALGTEPEEAAPAGTVLAGVVSAGEQVLTTIGRWLGVPTAPRGGATPSEVSVDPVSTGQGSAATTLEAAAASAGDGSDAPAGTNHAARGAGTMTDPRASAGGLPSGAGADTPAATTQGGGGTSEAVFDVADAARTTAPTAVATTTSAVAASHAPTIPDVTTTTNPTTAAPASATAAPPPPPADASSLAGRIMGRVLDALDVLENAPPPRRMTVDIGDPSGTRLQVALRGSEVHISVLGGGPEPQLTGWNKDLSAALAARGFSLGNSDADHGRRRDQDGAAPDEQPSDTPSPSGATAIAPVTPDTGLRL